MLATPLHNSFVRSGAHYNIIVRSARNLYIDSWSSLHDRGATDLCSSTVEVEHIYVTAQRWSNGSIWSGAMDCRYIESNFFNIALHLRQCLFCKVASYTTRRCSVKIRLWQPLCRVAWWVFEIFLSHFLDLQIGILTRLGPTQMLKKKYGYIYIY